MNFAYGGWLILILIAVFDAREHRIPNLLVATLITFCLFQQWFMTHELYSVLITLGCGITLFVLGLVLYFARIMAPGDVKLLAGIGCFLGWEQLQSGLYWIAIASVVVGLFYASLHLAMQPKSLRQLLGRYQTYLYLNKSAIRAPQVSRSSSKLRMPFAPIVVIGLALNNYLG